MRVHFFFFATFLPSVLLPSFLNCDASVLISQVILIPCRLKNSCDEMDLLNNNLPFPLVTFFFRKIKYVERRRITFSLNYFSSENT